MSDEAAVRAAFAQQATWCAQLGSPLTAAAMRLCGERLDHASAAGRRILGWAAAASADARGDALPLRLAGGLHDLARRGAIPALAAAYPPHSPPDDTALWAGIHAALQAPGDPLLPWLDSVPQTNEVARSAILMAGLMQVAAATGMPLALLELGASAGLNLVLDRYAYDLGGVPAGDPASLAPEWRGRHRTPAAVHVAARRGVDLNPIDATDPAARARMLAYVWADQPARLARIGTALDMAAADPPPLDAGDAAAWLEAVLSPAPQHGVARVVMHSIAAQYFPAATRSRIAAHLAACGASASAAGPLAWLRFEIDPEAGDRPALRLTLWPGGEDRLLAQGSAHGHWVAWRG